MKKCKVVIRKTETGAPPRVEVVADAKGDGVFVIPGVRSFTKRIEAGSAIVGVLELQEFRDETVDVDVGR